MNGLESRELPRSRNQKDFIARKAGKIRSRNKRVVDRSMDFSLDPAVLVGMEKRARLKNGNRDVAKRQHPCWGLNPF
jgi:hypothetical protein